MEQWKDAINETDITKKREKLMAYQRATGYRDYKNKVEEELTKLDFVRLAVDQVYQWQSIVKQPEIEMPTLYNIRTQIRAVAEAEQLVFKTVSEQIEPIIQEHQKNCKVIYEIAARPNQKDVFWLYHFLGLYKDYESYDEEQWIPKIKDRLVEMQKQSFENANKTKLITDYQAYHDDFCEQLEYPSLYCAEVKASLADLTDFENAHSEEQLANYLQMYPNGLKYDEAEKERLRLKRIRIKKASYEEIIQAPDSDEKWEKCSEYLIQFEEKDEQHQIVWEKYQQFAEIHKDKATFKKIEAENDIDKKLEMCKLYLINFYNGNYIKEIQIFKKQLFAKKEQFMYERAQKGDETDLHHYKEGDFPKILEHLNWVNQKLQLIRLEKEEANDFKLTIDEANCINYLKKYDTKGRNYLLVTKKLREFQLGITETQLDLKQEILNSRTTLTTDLNQMTGTIVETLQKTTHSQEKTQRAILVVLFTLFLFLMYIAKRVSKDNSTVNTEKTVFAK